MVVTCPDGPTTRWWCGPSPIARAGGRRPRDGAPSTTVHRGRHRRHRHSRRYERELGDLVDRYRLLTEVSPDAVFVHQDGRLVYGNRAASG